MTVVVVVPDHAEWPRYEIRVSEGMVEVHRQMIDDSRVYGPGAVPHRLLPFVLKAVADYQAGLGRGPGAFEPGAEAVKGVTDYQLGVERRIGRSAMEGRLVDLRPSPEEVAEAEVEDGVE